MPPIKPPNLPRVEGVPFGEVIIGSVFILGWAGSVRNLPDHFAYYTVLSAVAAVVSVAFWHISRRRAQESLWLRLIFSVFVVGYFVKFYLYLILIAVGSDAGSWFEEWKATDPDMLVRTYGISTFALVAFVTSAVLIVPRLRHGKGRSSTAYARFGQPLHLRGARQMSIGGYGLLWLASASALALLQIYLGNGIASSATSANVELPWRLSGLLQYSRMVLIPMLGLHLCWVSDRQGRSRLAEVYAAAVVLHGLANVGITTSKFAFIDAAISVFALWVVTKRMYRRRIWLLASSVMIALLLSAGGMYLRYFRSSEDRGVAESSVLAIDAMFSGSGLQDTIVGGLSRILSRINGADSLSNVVLTEPGFDLTRSWRILVESPATVDDQYARDVLGYGITFQAKGVAFSPSLLGFFEYVFGNIWITVCGVVCFVLCGWLLFSAVSRMPIEMNAALCASLMSYAMFLTSEGSFGTVPLNVAVRVAVAVGFQFVFRLAMGSKRHRQQRPMNNVLPMAQWAVMNRQAARREQ